MRSSTWQALANTYVVVESDEGARLDGVTARALSRGLDGVVEVLAASDDALELAIWNPDGSQAELSGNGTRIAATWLAERTGASDVSVHVGDREVRVRFLDGDEVEQDLGEVTVGEVTTLDGVTFVPVSVGNPHAVVLGDPDEIERVGPHLATHPHFPSGTNVQVVRIDGPGEVTARVWERGVGETKSSGSSAVAVAAATHGTGDVVVHFPGGDLQVRLVRGRACLFGPPPVRVDRA